MNDISQGLHHVILHAVSSIQWWTPAGIYPKDSFGQWKSQHFITCYT